jgi:hypothetical protein
MAKKKTDENAFDAFAGKKTPAKKTSPKITAQVNDEVKAAVDQAITNKAQVKLLEAETKKAELVIIEHVYPQQEIAAREGNYCKSFTVEGNDGTLTYTTIDKFSVPKEEDVEEEIRKLLGKEFDNYFRTLRTVKFTEEAMQDKNLINDMVAVAQEHKYEVPDVFTIVDELTTKKGMDESQFKLPKAKLAALRTLIKQYKASLK